MRDDLIVLKASEEAYHSFRNNTKDGHLFNRDLIEKKLTRAFILGKECWSKINKERYIQKRRYGNLEIIVNLDDMVIEKIINHYGRKRGYINRREKQDLGMLYSI